MTLFTTIILLACSEKATAGDNPIDTSNLWREMLKLEAVFRDTTHLGFNATVYLTDVDNVVTYDTMQISYKLSKQRYKIEMDSTIIIQNDFYHLAIYNEQDIAILTKPMQFGLNLLHVNLADSLFSRLNIHSLHASDSANYRKLSFQFNTGSPYTQYEILYDTTNYRISRIEYEVKKDPFNSGSTDHYHVKIVCSSYQTGAFTDSVFSTNGYFTRKQGIYSLVVPYTSYQFINSLNQ